MQFHLAQCLFGTAALALAVSPLQAQNRVYSMTNATANRVLVFDRAANGQLTPAGSVATGGQGTGVNLGSQGAIVLSDDNSRLFVVNGGSNDISVFSVTPAGLALVSRTPSGGTQPVSLTVSGNLLFVVNATSSNIAGFHIGDNGALTPLPGSVRPLSGTNTGPAQIGFTNDGETLVVTEKNTNLIDTYQLEEGMVTGPATHVSQGMTPFGFAFDKRGHLLVSEAGPNAISSYDVLEDGGLKVISASVPTHELAPCWVVVTRNGRVAYTADAHNGFLTGLTVAHDGSLAVLNQTATGGTPLDLALSAGGRFLYVLNTGAGTIDVLSVSAGGMLAAVQQMAGIPASATGIAAH